MHSTWASHRHSACLLSTFVALTYILHVTCSYPPKDRAFVSFLKKQHTNYFHHPKNVSPVCANPLFPTGTRNNHSTSAKRSLVANLEPDKTFSNNIYHIISSVWGMNTESLRRLQHPCLTLPAPKSLHIAEGSVNSGGGGEGCCCCPTLASD